MVKNDVSVIPSFVILMVKIWIFGFSPGVCPTEPSNLVFSLGCLVSNGRWALLGGIRLGGSATFLNGLTPTGCLHTSWSSSSGVLSYCLGILTLPMGYATVQGWWCRGSKEIQSMWKSWWGNILGSGYSFLEYRYARPMTRCSRSSLRGSSFLSG